MTKTEVPVTAALTTTTLIRALMKIKPAVESKSTIPILSMVRMVASKGTLNLTATDLELGIKTSLPAPGEYDIVAPPRLLLACLRTLPKNAEVTIAPGKQHAIQLTHGTFTARIDGMSPESWPCLPETPPTEPLPGAALRRILQQTRRAVSFEESRFSLNGLRLTSGPSGIQTAATDGHRMHVATEEGAYVKHMSLVKKDALPIVEAMAKSGDIWLADDDNHHFFTDGVTTLIARKLRGNFPQVQKVLDAPYAFETPLNLSDTIGALASVTPFTDTSSRLVRLTMKEKMLTATAHVLETGEASVSIPCEYEGEFDAGFNAAYLLDALRACRGPSVLMKFSDPKSQVEIAEPGFRAIIMPMRV